MTSFMGPMAPPPAAPAQPQALDIRTDPNQRQQFKQFMKQRTATMPMTSAPIAQPPMMPMMQPSMPMGQDIDIFNPVNLHDGGIVPSLNSLQQQAAQFAEQLQSTVMGGGQGGGMGGGGFPGGGYSDPSTVPLPSPPPLPGYATGISDSPSEKLPPGQFRQPDTGLIVGFDDPIMDYSNPSRYIFPTISPSASTISTADYVFNRDPITGEEDPSLGGGPSYTFNPNENQNRNPFFGGREPSSYGLPGGATYGFEDGGVVGFNKGGSTEPIEERFMESHGRTGLFRGNTFLGFKQEPKKKEADPLLSFANVKRFFGFEDGGAVPSTLPRSKRDAVAQKVAEMMAIDAERVRAAQQNAEYNRLLRDQDAIDRQVALDRLRADQAESRQNMTLDSILSDINYEARGLLRKADGGAVPPRRADIGGQDHMLSYITPDEADILMALGGSGEAGPMGIPAFPEPGMGGDQDSRGGSGNEGGGSSGGGGGSSGGDTGGDSGAGEGGDTYSDMGMSPGRSQAQFGTTEFAGKSEQEAQDIVDSGGGSDEAQAVQQSIAAQQRADAQRAAAAEAARQSQIRNQQIAQDNINRINDRVQAGLGQRNIGVGTTPEVNLSVTRNPTPTTFNVADTLGTGIASTVNTGPRDTRGPDAGRTDLLGIDDLLAIDDIASRPPGEMFDPNQTQFTERGLVTDVAPSSFTDPLSEMFGYNMAPSPEEVALAASVSPVADTSAVAVSMPNQIGITAPSVSTTTTTPTGTTTSAPIGMDDEYDDITDPKDEFYDDPNREGYSAGLPTGLDFIDTPQGRMTTNLAGTTAAQRAAMPGYMNTRNEDGSLRGGIAGLVDPILGNPVSSVYGYEIPDLATGQITGFTGPSNMPGMIGSGLNFLQDLFMGPPKTTEDLLQRGVYTGFGPGSQIGMEEGGEDRPVKPPTDPCPDGFVMKNGACTPIEDGDGGIGDINPPVAGPPSPPPPSVIVPSPRPPYIPPPSFFPPTFPPSRIRGQGPVGYGSPIAGQMAPAVANSAAMYQQILNQQAANPPQFMPIRFQQGGSVSSNLDMAADNFLKALMPAA